MVIKGKVTFIDAFVNAVMLNETEIQLTDKMWKYMKPQPGDIISLDYDKTTGTAFGGYVIKRGRNGKN